jgi:hypothetical protein
MKNTFLFLFILFQPLLFAGPIRYRYDAAGNRIQRLIYVYDPTEDVNENPNGRFALPVAEEKSDKQDDKEEKEFISADFKLLVFPNPAETYITLNILDYKNLNLKAAIAIFDNQSRQLLQTNSEQLNNQIDVNNLQPGMYYLQVIIDSKRVVYPFEKLAK